MSQGGGCPLGMRGPTGITEIDAVNVPVYADILKLSSRDDAQARHHNIVASQQYRDEIEFIQELYRAYALDLKLPDMWHSKPEKCGNRRKKELSSITIDFFKAVDFQKMTSIQSNEVVMGTIKLHLGIIKEKHFFK
ncbi:Hypothetical protein POVR1_LOCUS80 [uncultured virus]|nr:Hypothetical protein POVR1_LOCUS80 [uncultured virus]